MRDKDELTTELNGNDYHWRILQIHDEEESGLGDFIEDEELIGKGNPIDPSIIQNIAALGERARALRERLEPKSDYEIPRGQIMGFDYGANYWRHQTQYADLKEPKEDIVTTALRLAKADEECQGTSLSAIKRRYGKITMALENKAKQEKDKFKQAVESNLSVYLKKRLQQSKLKDLSGVELSKLEKTFISYIKDIIFYYCEKKDRQRLTHKCSALIKLVADELQVEVMYIPDDLEKQFKIFCNSHPDAKQYMEIDATFNVTPSNVLFREFGAASDIPVELRDLLGQTNGFLPSPRPKSSLIEEVD